MEMLIRHKHGEQTRINYYTGLHVERFRFHFHGQCSPKQPEGQNLGIVLNEEAYRLLV